MNSSRGQWHRLLFLNSFGPNRLHAPGDFETPPVIDEPLPPRDMQVRHSG